MTRDYPDRPIVGVAAVVIEDDRVVLVRRGRPPAYGEWTLPGGAVESGETLEDAVIREVAEEIGLKVEVVEVVAVLDRIFWDQEGEVQYHYVLIDFLCRKTGGKLQASSDAISCSQVPFSALAQYKLSRETKGVIRRAYQRVNGGSPHFYRGKAATPIQS
jgi:8-oxo-dGTP diphosphatase